MRLAPTPTPGTTSSTTCNPKTHACDTPGGEGATAGTVFVVCTTLVLLVVWATSRGKGD